MNAFMLFAKRHRSVVREHYPNFDNRTTSKILSEWWYALASDCKQKYKDLADEIKVEHNRAYPSFQWKSKAPKVVADANADADADAMQYMPKNFQRTEMTSVDDFGGLKRKSTESIDLMNSDAKRAATAELKTTSATDNATLVSAVASMGIRRSDRQQKRMLTKASTEALINGERSSPLGDRFRSLPKFDYGNFKSPTQWPAFGAQRERSQTKNRLKVGVASSPNDSEFVANKSASIGDEANWTTSKLARFESRKKVIMALFSKCGMYPPPNEISNILVKSLQKHYRHSSRSILKEC